MIGRITKTMTAVAVLAAMALLPGIRAQAQEEAAAADPNTGAISVTAGVDYISQYWFRGLAQENQGAIVQPYVDLGFNLYSAEEGPLSSVDLNVGIWGSLHSGPSGSGIGGPGNFLYEMDYYAGISATILDFTAGVIYTAYTSPNGFFATTQEIAVKVSYDDAALWKSLIGESSGFGGLQPWALIAFEFDGAADGASKGIYLELGIKPSIELGFIEKYPITLSFPIVLGLSLDDYYEVGTTDSTFGYVTLGVEASVPLSFIPARFGSWDFHAGVYVIVLGTNPKAIAGGAVTGGDTAEIFAKFGIGFSY
ncbi:MAG: TorF family putative porin [Phycisphaeraceae bacterium]